MTYWISTSGGIASAISSIIAHEKGLDYEMVFADTLLEHPDLYRFINEVAAKLGKKIYRVADGRNVWQVFVDNRFIGNTRTAHCSKVLKTDKVKAFLEEYAQPHDALVLGMDFSELDRIERAQKNWYPRQVVSLINLYKVWRPEWPAMLERYGICPPELYAYGFPHNNCGGFCVRAGLKQFATLLEMNPNFYALHEMFQEWAMQKIGPTARPFLRRTLKGVTHYMTMREFRELYQAGEIKVDPYDFGGCGCFVDGDE